MKYLSENAANPAVNRTCAKSREGRFLLRYSAATRALLALGIVVVVSTRAAHSQDLIETEIKGEILRNGVPVVGAVITSCKDYDSSPKRQTDCAERIRVITDRLGRFSFVRPTGINPATFFCGSPCAKDPSWRYWFSVSDRGTLRSAYEIGMGFGMLYVRISCDLAMAPRHPGEDIVCNSINIEQRAAR